MRTQTKEKAIKLTERVIKLIGMNKITHSYEKNT